MGMRALIAESRTIYRAGLRAIFLSDPSITSLEEAMTSEALKNKLTSTPFDFVVVHQSLITDIALLPRNHFVILASEPDKSTLVAAFNHGACGYFLEDPLEDLLRATLHLPKGGCLLDSALTLWVAEHISNERLASINIEILTTREQEVFALYKSGFNQAEIAKKLCIARSTVKRHLANIYSKLELKRGSRKTLALLSADLITTYRSAHTDDQE